MLFKTPYFQRESSCFTTFTVRLSPCRCLQSALHKITFQNIYSYHLLLIPCISIFPVDISAGSADTRWVGLNVNICWWDMIGYVPTWFGLVLPI